LTLSIDRNDYVKAQAMRNSCGISTLINTENLAYTIDRDSGLMQAARQCPSPNQNARPGDCDPSAIIVHGISLPPGEFGGGFIEKLFTNCLDWDAHPYFDEIRDFRVSAHLLVQRDGAVVQFVPFTQRAWHAGESQFRGVPRCNDYSIGIELEGEDNTQYANNQYAALVSALIAIMQAWPNITVRQIAGHCDVAPGRKSDPGPAFDWLRLYDGLAGYGPQTS